ncbi:MAG: hypothetical protein ACE15C_04770 [Phycisphaerae bacterium]
MEIEDRQAGRVGPFVTMVVFLLAMAGGLIAIFVLTSRGVHDVTVHGATAVASSPASKASTSGPVAGAPTAAPAPQGLPKLLARLAVVSIAMLCLTAVMLFWVVARFLMQRLRPEGRHARTPYVDAWSLAGKRAKPEEDEDARKEDYEGPEDDGEETVR